MVPARCGSVASRRASVVRKSWTRETSVDDGMAGTHPFRLPSIIVSGVLCVGLLLGINPTRDDFRRSTISPPPSAGCKGASAFDLAMRPVTVGDRETMSNLGYNLAY